MNTPEPRGRTSAPLRILIIDDSAGDAELVLGAIDQVSLASLGGERPAITSSRVETSAALADALAREAWDVVLLECATPGISSIEVGAAVRASAPNAPLIVVSRAPAETAALVALRARAHAFVPKADLPALAAVIDLEIAASNERVASARLRDAQKMEAIVRFARGIAHDFNNILSVILGHADLALLDLESGHPVRMDIEEIRRAAARAADVTKHLLLFSRRTLEPTTVDLRTVVAELEPTLRALAGESIEVVRVLSSSPVRVSVDAAHLEQIVLNLAGNACDAMPGGGRLTIEVSATGDASRPMAELVVKDDGTGIDRATRPLIFEPFFTTKPPRNRTQPPGVGRGIGLGLPTVLGIVEQSGGQVAIESAPGKGTTVRVLLPRLVDG